MVKINKFTNLQLASKKCFFDFRDYLIKNNERIKIILSGGTSLKYFNKNFKKYNPKKKINLYLADERITDLSKYQNSNTLKKIKNKKFVFVNIFKNPSITKLEKISSYLPKSSYVSVLGIGEDGHIASIFDSGGRMEFDKNLILSKKKDEKYIRISLSFEYISKSKKIFLIISNKRKLQSIKNKDTTVYKLLKKNKRKISLYYSSS